MIYLDTSVIAPLYWTEAPTNAIEALLSDVGIVPAISSLVEVELISALSRRVRTGEIAQEQAELIKQEFQAGLDVGFYTRLILEPVHYQIAQTWIGQFNTPLRTLDALHLAVAFSNNISLLTADEGLIASATTLGVDVKLLEPIEIE